MKVKQVRTSSHRPRRLKPPSIVIVGSRTIVGLQPGATKVMTALGEGSRSWDDLRKQTKLTDDQLGLTLAELLDRKLVATRTGKDGERVYLPVDK